MSWEWDDVSSASSSSSSSCLSFFIFGLSSFGVLLLYLSPGMRAVCALFLFCVAVPPDVLLPPCPLFFTLALSFVVVVVTHAPYPVEQNKRTMTCAASPSGAFSWLGPAFCVTFMLALKLTASLDAFLHMCRCEESRPSRS